nr:hypothetical protein Iba_chr08fCG0830 [Ipomoea batatas]
MSALWRISGKCMVIRHPRACFASPFIGVSSPFHLPPEILSQQCLSEADGRVQPTLNLPPVPPPVVTHYDFANFDDLTDPSGCGYETLNLACHRDFGSFLPPSLLKF